MFELISYLIVIDKRFRKIFFVKNPIVYIIVIWLINFLLLTLSFFYFNNENFKIIFYIKVGIDITNTVFFYPTILFKLFKLKKKFTNKNDLLKITEKNNYNKENDLSLFLERSEMNKNLNFTISIFGAIYFFLGLIGNILNFHLLINLKLELIWFTLIGFVDFFLFLIIFVLFLTINVYYIIIKHSIKYLQKSINHYEF